MYKLLRFGSFAFSKFLKLVGTLLPYRCIQGQIYQSTSVLTPI